MKPASDPRTVGGVLSALVAHPVDRLIRRWNWKAATLSAASRGLLFFLVNLAGGLDAARAAFVTEFVVRAVTSGFYGTITQSFRSVEPVWAGTVAALLVLPLLSHSVEFVAHWIRGTEALLASITASLVFTAISTAFHLHAMRQNVLTVGAGSHSLRSDLRALPWVLLSFLGLRNTRRMQCVAVDTTDGRT
jgi:hypothetical protein